MKFWIACNPPRSTAQSQKRIGLRGKTPILYTTAKGKAQEADFMSLLHPFRPVQPYDGALRLGISYCLPLLKTERKAIREQGWTTHSKRPDGDNLVKMFQDTMRRHHAATAPPPLRLHVRETVDLLNIKEKKGI